MLSFLLPDLTPQTPEFSLGWGRLPETRWKPVCSLCGDQRLCVWYGVGRVQGLGRWLEV